MARCPSSGFFAPREPAFMLLSSITGLPISRGGYQALLVSAAQHHFLLLFTPSHVTGQGGQQDTHRFSGERGPTATPGKMPTPVVSHARSARPESPGQLQPQGTLLQESSADFAQECDS